MAAINQITFQANWNASNVHLQNNIFKIWELSEAPILSKVYLCFCKIIDSVVHFFTSPLKHLCRSMVLPSSEFPQVYHDVIEERWSDFWSGPINEGSSNPVRQTYEASNLDITTPDGTSVKGAFYRHRSAASQDVPTIVCFNPNAMLAKSSCWDWLLNKGINSPIPFNLVVFDYRKKDELTDDSQCVLDGDAVIQCLHQQMGISKNNLHMIGYSFGGGISAHVRALHQDAGNYVNLRSFASIGHVVQHSKIIDPFIPQILRGGCASKIIKVVLGSLLSALHWGINVKEPLQLIGDRALVVYHPEDHVIPAAASAAEYVDGSQAVQMRFKPTVSNAPEDINHHGLNLKCYEDENGLNISKRILNALLGTHHFQQHRPLENRRQHNLGDFTHLL